MSFLDTWGQLLKKCLQRDRPTGKGFPARPGWPTPLVTIMADQLGQL